ncbi:fumarylacetoacetate hydrolase family protein [Rhodococcus fascians]|jgi:2-keto-4-pentenoate hydratase/2-oxohepta-3-ene-1,7-dioic acid hydratase in catechol pathway|uniref:fumarylacetoacetate hydrolase family protein n=1 Tax=Rhodococcoides fascians TaxID=1828 RepID=UPI00195AB5E1|nr:fumarylacetoacetate hydrolase family protein [Rhodococcus fascians]MBM7242832.1 fumarylacetoacetate hydrolase family protein [Rhodococcus fascians]MBY3809072.1 fumarylacetoacetate hydrolase family protein [Rhodococcus fascians]MBY3840980.1 fumarylacetoacetate hydrolase family protein [Rhodococcus fascians]MBY3846243.1 fumarylacetoacetate hydrolase family protein [Rhodococcus fascians]MBY3851186.1 fumarylacetoacetate hydrolase family protein [Rhodococcus fascians]
MSIAVLRTADAWWVETPAGASRIDTSATTTAELLADRAAVDAARTGTDVVAVETLSLVSPVTAPCRVVANMTNFVSHVKDSGMNPDTVPLTFFRKTSGSISGPTDDIVKPPHVKLLDYEIEIGLVFGKTLTVGTKIDASNVAEYVAGLVITNDVSARDVQLPKTQFYEGKSYPTFTPVGPRLLLLEAGEFDRFGELTLTLRVNGTVRQDSTVADMIYRPVESLKALSKFQRLDAGDLLLTGTPGGTALKAPAKPIEMIGSLIPPALKWKVFFKKQAKNPDFLQDGDVLELTCSTPDGSLDLGVQRTRVSYR